MSLPSYKSLRADINTMIEYSSRAAVASRMSIFGGMPKMVQHEGDKATFVQSNGEVENIEYKKVSVERIITDEDLKTMSIEDVIEMANNIGTEVGDSQAKEIFQSVKESTEKTGNVVSGGGEKFSMDLFFQTVEKIDIEFDDDGNPRMPSMYIHPSMSDRIKEVMENDAETPENVERHKMMMIKKKEEFDARESRRKLVD